MDGGVDLMKSDCGQVLMEQRRNKIPNQLNMQRKVSMLFRENGEVDEARC